MFLCVMERTRATSRHFRVSIPSNFNTSRLLLSFWGVTRARGVTRGIRSRGVAINWICVLRFSKTHHVFANSGGNPGHLSALPRRDFKKVQYLPATFAILGGNPGVTRGIRSRGVAMYLFTLQEKSTPPGYFCGSGGQPFG